MADREKVIKGMKQHRDGRFHSCDNCPYVHDISCQLKLYSDVVELLEKQEEEIQQLMLALDIAKGTTIFLSPMVSYGDVPVAWGLGDIDKKV